MARRELEDISPSAVVVMLIALSATSGFLALSDAVIDYSYYPSISTEVEVTRRLFTAPTFQVKLSSLDRGDGVSLKAHVWMPEVTLLR